MPLHLVIFGRQGAGKGTQSQRIVDAYGVVHVSTGDMLRAAIQNRTELGLAAQRLVESGALVDDQTMIGIVADRMAEADIAERGVLLDGFPRTPAQADELVRILGAKRPITAAINLEVPVAEVTARMMTRGRPDDTPEGIATRLGLYESQTRPLLDWFAARGLLVEVDGLGAEEVVFARIRTALDQSVEGAEVGTGDADQ